MCAESLALSSPCLPTVPFPAPCQKASWKAGGSRFGLVHLKRFFFSAISQDFLAFCTACLLETLLRNFTQQWLSSSLKYYHDSGWGEKNSHRPFLTWAPLLVHPFTQNTSHVVVLLFFGPLLLRIYRVKHLCCVLEVCRVKHLYWYGLWLQYP